MNIAVEKALNVLRIHGLSDSYVGCQQISTILDKESIIFYTFPFQGNLKERYVATEDGIVQIAVKGDLPLAEKKHMFAHALGHHFLHRGNYAYIDGIVQDKQENQAEDFAAVLLAPPAILGQARPIDMFEFAQECGIPKALAARRFKIFDTHGI